jgi:peptide/nickel transport system substrate-binding protein
MHSSVTRVRGGRAWLQALGAIFAVIVIAAGCGSSGNGGGSDQGAGAPDVTQESSGPVQMGGTVIYGLEAETSGFDPTFDRWAISGNMVAFAIFDPLAAYNAEGEWAPYLAQAFEPNATFDEWRIRVRPNIQFHNGEPLDGAAVAGALSGIKASALAGAALRVVDTISVDPADPMSVIVTTSQSWASFPATLTGQAGVVPAPAQQNLPQGDQKSSQPIGTGPFVYENWVPDNNFTANRNPNYWMKDEQGNAMPYLETVEFRPIPDVQTRSSSLLSNTINMLHTTNNVEIAALKAQAESGTIQAVEDRGENEETFIMLNSSAEPFDDVIARNAVAFATPYESYLNVFQIDPGLATDSAFGAESPFYFDSEFPVQDEERARQLVQEYETKYGRPLSFTLGTTPVPQNVQAAQLLQEAYNAVGMDVRVNAVEQGQYITDAVFGRYQANLWRQFGANDPDADYVWWHMDNIPDDPSGISLNIARFSNPELSEALDAARATPDVEERKRHYQTVQEIWARETPYIWLNTTTWLIAADNSIRDFWNNKLPNEQNVAAIEAIPFQSGSHRLTGTWMES